MIKWLCIPVVGIGPKNIYYNVDTRDQCIPIVFAQYDQSFPIPKYRLLKPHSLTDNELKRMCDDLGIDSNGTRRVVLDHLCDFLCSQDSNEVRELYRQQIHSVDQKPRGAPKRVKPLTKDALFGLDPEDQGEFGDLKDIRCDANFEISTPAKN